MAEDSILDVPAQAVDGRHGTTDTAVLVKFPSGEVVPVGVQVGRCARDYLGVYGAEDGYTIVGARRGNTTIDLPG